MNNHFWTKFCRNLALPSFLHFVEKKMNSRDFNINCKLFRNSGCWVMLVLLCVLLAGCDSKHNAVYELHLFRENIQNHGSKYSQMEWEQAIEEYADICKRLDEMPLTDEERMEIDKVKGEIAGHATTIAAQDISDKIQTIANEIESFAEGFNKTFQLPTKRK